MRFRTPLLLAILVAGSLTPFLGKAFHLDDALFVWAGKQIAAHPGDPYGFQVTWYTFPQPMSEVTQNPPLASYYIAAAAAVFGWSEVALHAAFLLPALLAILGTYYLARKFTRRPLLAALATLASPGFLVSSTTLMCDTMLLAFWLWATLAWIEGLDRKRRLLLFGAALLIALAAMTKYFGIALLPLLLVYTLSRERRAGSRLVYLCAPVLCLIAYEQWSRNVYGVGLLFSASQYASGFGATAGVNLSKHLYQALVGLSFTGGCVLPALVCAPLLWRRKWIVLTLLGAAAAGFAMGMGAIDMPSSKDLAVWYRPYLSLQLMLYIAGGCSALALAWSDWRTKRDAGSGLLLLWVAGTLCFASFVNWSGNARSVLPMIPAVAILLVRRVESDAAAFRPVAASLALCGAISLWVAGADVTLANSARTAAQYMRDRVSSAAVKVSFEGHWGFQYYMEAFGFTPVYFQSSHFGPRDVLVIPHNNTNSSLKSVDPSTVASDQTATFPVAPGVSTMSFVLGAGFYSDVWGPLPYAFGPIPPEEYSVIHFRGTETGGPR